MRDHHGSSYEEGYNGEPTLNHMQNFLREWFTTLRRGKWTSVTQFGRRKEDFDADAVDVSASTHEERRPGFDQGELSGT